MTKKNFYAQGRITPRLSTPSYQNQKLLQNKFSSIQRDNVELSAHRTLAEQIMTALEVPPATRTLGTDGNPARFCLVGSCCGWGHRLVRQVQERPHILSYDLKCTLSTLLFQEIINSFINFRLKSLLIFITSKTRR